MLFCAVGLLPCSLPLQWVGIHALAAAVAIALVAAVASALCAPFHRRLALVPLARSTALAIAPDALVIALSGRQ